MINTQELRIERAELVKQCRAILDKADKDNRSLSTEERIDYGKIWPEAEKLATKIQDIETRNDLEREETALKMRQEDERRDRSNPNSEKPETTGSLSFRDQDGNLIPAIKHGESFRSMLKLKPPPVRPGRLLRAAITGEWPGREMQELRSTYAGALDTAGGYLLTPAMSAELVDLARAKSVISKAGARTISLPENADSLKIVVVESDPTADWIPERVEITESTGTFGQIRMRPRALCVYCEASLELMRDASNAEAIIERTIGSAIALKLDESALNGIGTDEEPSGLLNSSLVTANDVAGAFDFDKLIDGAAVAWGNDVEPTAFIYDAALRAYVAKLKDGQGNYEQGPQLWNDLKVLMSTQVSSNDANNVAYLGDFSNVLIGVRSGLEIQMSGLAGDTFQKKKVAIRGMMRCDVTPCRDGDIIRMHGITGT